MLLPPKPPTPLEAVRWRPQTRRREEGFAVPRRTVCGEAVERSAGRSGTVNPSSTHEPEGAPRTRRQARHPFLAEIKTTAHLEHSHIKEASILYALRGYECPEN